MSKALIHKYQRHDGFFRFVLNRERDCVVDLIKMLEHYGGSSDMQDLFSLVDWQRSEQVTDAFFERGGRRITFADLVYRFYFIGTDYYFYLLAEHKDRLVGSYRPFLQMDGYATRIRERDKGKLVLSLLLIGSGKSPEHSNYVDAALAKLDLPVQVLAALQNCRGSFATHKQLMVALQRVPDAVLLDGKTFACPAVPYVIKHNKSFTPDKVAKLLSLCRAMLARQKVASHAPQSEEVVVEGILCYGISVSGLSEEEWLAIEIADCPHLPKEELAMYKREFGLEVFERDLAECKAAGIEQGKAEGKLEERRDIALRLLKKGKSDTEIIDTTGFTQKELALLKKSL